MVLRVQSDLMGAWVLDTEKRGDLRTEKIGMGRRNHEALTHFLVTESRKMANKIEIETITETALVVDETNLHGSRTERTTINLQHQETVTATVKDWQSEAGDGEKRTVMKETTE